MLILESQQRGIWRSVSFPYFDYPASVRIELSDIRLKDTILDSSATDVCERERERGREGESETLCAREGGCCTLTCSSYLHLVRPRRSTLAA